MKVTWYKSKWMRVKSRGAAVEFKLVLFTIMRVCTKLFLFYSSKKDRIKSKSINISCHTYVGYWIFSNSNLVTRQLVHNLSPGHKIHVFSLFKYVSSDKSVLQIYFVSESWYFKFWFLGIRAIDIKNIYLEFFSCKHKISDKKQ